MERDHGLEVHAHEDFIDNLAAGRPAYAFADFICNGLDAEAAKSFSRDQGFTDKRYIDDQIVSECASGSF